MKPEFNEFETYCYNLLYENLEIDIFEEWVYTYDKLKEILNPDDYLDLISLDYKKKANEYQIDSIKHQVKNILKNYLDYGKFETKYILSLLYKALNSKKELPYILIKFYDLFDNGYFFLEDLGIGYGLGIEFPSSKNYKYQKWDKLAEREKDRIIESFYPKVENDLKKVIKQIENDEIILTGKKNELNQWKYIDKRNDDIGINKETRKNYKRWWEFWK